MDLLNLPSSLEAEKNVIGAIISEQNYITQVADYLRPEHFSDGTHREIYMRLLDMYDNGRDIDLTTALNACRGIMLPEGLRMAVLLSEYTTSAPTTASIESHARIIVEQHIRRTICVDAQQLAKRCAENSEDVADILKDLDTLTDKCNGVIVGGGAKHISELITQAIAEAEKRQKTAINGQSVGITTGITQLDRATGGWKPAQLIVLAARPAMGKTAIMLHFALSASQQGKAVCIFALEMSGVSLADRLLCSVANVDAENYKNGTLTSEEWGRINEAQAEINNLPIYIDDNPTVTMRYIATRSKMLRKRGKCDIIFADYLQLVDTSTGKNRNREQEIAQASRKAKIIAKELGVPFILLSQLSRKVEDRADKTPQLSDLRESGAIEQDADIVVFIHRPAYYGEQTMETSKWGEISTEGVGVLSLAKQREGATGKTYFSHNDAMTKIYDYEHNASDTPY